MLVVIEAGDRSGALITSRIALELGRTVAAVPGPIDSPRHTGSNRLLRDGAAFIGDIEDVLLAAGLGARRAVEAQAAPLSGDPEPSGTVDPSHAAILNAVMAGASELEDLARSTRLSPREFATALSTLELAGQLLVTPGGNVSLFGRA
jgi:DNA processing protein